MKAFRFDRPGGPEVLRFEDVPLPEPGPGEVRIRHTAVALNFRDILVRRGQHAVKAFPSGLGTESAGVIEAVGAGVTDFVGRRPRRHGLPPRLRLCRGAHRAGRARRQAAGRHRRAHRGLDDGPRHDRALSPPRHLQGETRRHHRDPCRRRRRRPDRQPMGQASRRHRDRHRRQRRQGRDRPRPRLRPRAALRRFRRRRCARSPAARACRWSTIRSARPRSRTRSSVLRRAASSPRSANPPAIRRRSRRAQLGNMGSLFVTHPSLIDYTATRADLLETANDLFAMVGSGKIKIEISQELSAARGRAGAPRRRGAQDHRLRRPDPLSAAP